MGTAFTLAKGCRASDLEDIHEGFSTKESPGYCVFTVNVSAENVPNVFLRLTELPREPVFFLLEVGTHRDEEQNLRKSEDAPFHKDVYYLDGLSGRSAKDIFSKYESLLVNDGGVCFGVGSHGKAPTSDEVFVGAYKVFYIYASEPSKYAEALEGLGFGREAKIKTVWDTFTADSPGRRTVLTDQEITIWDMVEQLKKEGLYLAERRED